jgi:hypothetical protein
MLVAVPAGWLSANQRAPTGRREPNGQDAARHHMERISGVTRGVRPTAGRLLAGVPVLAVAVAVALAAGACAKGPEAGAPASAPATRTGDGIADGLGSPATGAPGTVSTTLPDVPDLSPISALPTRRGPEAMRAYLLEVADCSDIDDEPSPLADIESVELTFGCGSAELYTGVAMTGTPLSALELAFDFAVVNANDENCVVSMSAGRWHLGMAGDLAIGESIVRTIATGLNAVVHDACGITDLEPDTLTLTGALSGYGTCMPAPVVMPPANDPSTTVTWDDFDTAFSCEGAMNIVRLLPSNVDRYRDWARANGICGSYVTAGRWLVYSSQPRSGSGLADAALGRIATAVGGSVDDPCVV